MRTVSDLRPSKAALFTGYEKIVIGEIAVEQAQCRLGAAAMILDNCGIERGGEQLQLPKLDAVTAMNWRRKPVGVPVEPLANPLMYYAMVGAKLPERRSKILEDGARLDEGMVAMLQHWHLSPSRELAKLRGQVHTLLKAHVAEAKRLA